MAELRARKRHIGNPNTIVIRGDQISGIDDWRNDPVRSLFLILSLFRLYPDWAKDIKNSSQQGLVFEKIVEVLCANLFLGWEVYRVGWSPDNTPNIFEVVNTLVDKLNCRGATDLSEWVADQGKDGGLDVICYRFFDDDKEALPIFLIQCASGNNWRNKIHTPNASEWKKWLNAAVDPGTGIAAPFVIDDKMLRTAALAGQVIVIDRLRLLRAYYDKPSVVPQALKDEIVAWLEPYMDILPFM